VSDKRRTGNLARLHSVAGALNHTSKCQKRCQDFVGAHGKALAVAMRVNNPDRSPSPSRAETQPKLHPASWSLSAIISQYFTGRILPF
jgi:hypothetical protein